MPNQHPAPEPSRSRSQASRRRFPRPLLFRGEWLDLDSYLAILDAAESEGAPAADSTGSSEVARTTAGGADPEPL